MPIRERTAWISLVLTAGVWGVYFWKLWPQLNDGALPARSIGLFLNAAAILVVIQVVIAIVLTIATGKSDDEAMDEREQLIDLKGTRAGFGLINVLLVAVASLWLVGASPLVMANGILAAMVVAEVVRSASIIVGFRRGV